MALDAGARFGPYEIVTAIGAGGMGEVYRARDTRLDRTVAIKVLPPSLAADPHLRERFDREARAISSLNHPHICTLYDVGRQDGTDYLVLEYLEGETLDARLKSAPGSGLPSRDALRIATEILDALDKAHRSGIVHRDLKPANVMLTKSGAKLLDFGLAKSAAPVIATSGLSMAPTTPPTLTAQGTILGTFQYMAPEQIEGLDADARTDIFAFGAVLFEMLTGRPAFEGKTRAQLLGAILKDEPPTVSSLNAAIPKSLDRIVATCLAKDPDDRWQTARDLLRELRWATAERDVRNAEAGRRGSRFGGSLTWALLGMLTVALVATGTLAWRHLREIPSVAESLQFTVAPPDNTQLGGPAGGGSGSATQLAISPDGRSIVLVARADTKYTLWLRTLATAGFRQLTGTDDAAFPFWSPDSRFIGFFAGGKLKKVQAAGGPPITLCDALQGRGGTWNRDNVIVFGILTHPLQRVSAAGGTPTPVGQLDKSYSETSQRFPQFLPDGRHILFTGATGAAGAAPKPSRIRIGALDGTPAETLLEAESSVAYADGHLLFLRDASLMAEPFDPVSLKFTGDPFPVAEQVGTEGSRYTSFSVSATGTLVYAHGGLLPASRLTWFDRSGRALGDVSDPAAYLGASLSPDERRVAATIASSDGLNPVRTNVWIIDVARNVSSRLTFGTAEQYPVWSRDSSRVLFLSMNAQAPGIYEKAAAGTRDEELVLKGVENAIGAGSGLPSPNDWSPDSRFILYQIASGSPSGTDLWVLPQSGDKKPFPIVQGPGPDANATFSPDGRWIAYNAAESSTSQVYVQPFPPTGGRFQVSKDGGAQPRWRGDGRELFFLALDGRMMAAPIEPSPEFQPGLPKALFNTGSLLTANAGQYAATKDGNRFLVIVPRSSDRNATQTPLTVIVNWLATLQK